MAELKHDLGHLVIAVTSVNYAMVKGWWEKVGVAGMQVKRLLAALGIIAIILFHTVVTPFLSLHVQCNASPNSLAPVPK